MMFEIKKSPLIVTQTYCHSQYHEQICQRFTFKTEKYTCYGADSFTVCTVKSSKVYKEICEMTYEKNVQIVSLAKSTSHSTTTRIGSCMCKG
jgi:hypothetical protein